MAAVDLEAFAVAKHISLDDAPTQVITSPGSASVYAVTPPSGTVHEILADRLSFRRNLQWPPLGRSSLWPFCTRDRFLYLLSREPRALTAVATDSLRVAWRVSLPEEPVEFSLPERETRGREFSERIRLLDFRPRKLSSPLGSRAIGTVRFARRQELSLRRIAPADAYPSTK